MLNGGTFLAFFLRGWESVLNMNRYERHTPLKFNMESENHLFEQENNFSNPSFLGSMFIFRGVDLRTL